MSGRSRRSVDLQLRGPRIRIQFGIDARRQSALEKNAMPVPAPVPLLAIIDTGASNSGVRAGTFASLGVRPTGTRIVWTAHGGRVDAPEYLGRMWFPGGVVLPVTVQELDLPGVEFGCLLGRDILAHGRLAYDGADGSCALVLRGVEVPLAGADSQAG